MKYNVGDKVFARVRGFPPWPARIMEPIKISHKNSVYDVFFYGTKQSAKVQTLNLYPFVEMKHILGRERKVKDFNESMTAILKDLTEKEKAKLTRIENELSSKDENNEPNKTTNSSVLKQKKLKRNIRSKVSRYGRKFKPKGVLDNSQSPIKPEIPETNDDADCETEKMDVDIEISRDKAPKDKFEDDRIFVRGLDPNNRKCILNELDLIDWEYELRRSLSLIDPQPIIANSVLDKIATLNITQVMLHKYPDIITTLMKTRRFHNKKNPEKFPPDIDEIIRDKSAVQLGKFERLFNVPEGMDFMDYFQRAHIEFSREIATMSPYDLMKLV